MSNNKSDRGRNVQGSAEPSGIGGTLIKSTAILAAGTLTSRILGFVRDIVLANLFGTGFRAEVFFLAQRIPNLLRDMVGEGAANSAVVPILSEYQANKDSKAFWQLVNVIALWALIILSGLTLFGMIFAPMIVTIMAPGFLTDPLKFKLAVELTRIIFPYLIFIGLTAHSMAVLYTLRSFTSPAFSPCLFNVAVIVSALLSARFLSEPTYGLAVGVLIGGILQLAVQMGPMFKKGLRWEKVSLSHPGAVQCGKLLGPRLIGSGVYQLSLVIDTLCASLSSIVGAGGIAAIYFSNRLIQLPMGVFGFSMATAALPTLSGMAARQEMEQFKRTVVFSLKNIFFVMLPMSAIFIIFSEPLVRILFQRGAFDAYSTQITSLSLTFFSLGLFSFGGSKILTTAFYALQDTRTPVKIAAGALLLNTILNFSLMWKMKIAGIALASSFASTSGFFMLIYILEKRIGDFSAELMRFFFAILGASVAAGLVMKALSSLPEHWGRLELIRLGLMVGIGCAVYLGVCLVLKIPQAEKVMKSLVRKSKSHD